MNGTGEATNDAFAATSGQSGATMAAWERFVGGEDAVGGVRPEILASWYRCREQYQVDPHLAQAPPAPSEEPGTGEQWLLHGTVFAELGGAAALAAAEVESASGIVTVTDADGCVLASWGEAKTLGLAAESNLAPWSAWPERTTGTNGMGTALECHELVTVQGPEHWCQGVHDGACAGVAIRDAATDKAIAVLNVSLRGTRIAARLGEWLRRNAASVQNGLGKRERQSGIAHAR